MTKLGCNIKPVRHYQFSYAGSCPKYYFSIEEKTSDCNDAMMM